MPYMLPSSAATVTTVTPVGNEPIAWRKALMPTVEAGAAGPAAWSTARSSCSVGMLMKRAADAA